MLVNRKANAKRQIVRNGDQFESVENRSRRFLLPGRLENTSDGNDAVLGVFGLLSRSEGMILYFSCPAGRRQNFSMKMARKIVRKSR